MAVFLVKWAAEIYASWATWMYQILPGCKTSYKRSAIRIVHKINEMEGPETLLEGCNKIYDLLRASYVCTSTQ